MARFDLYRLRPGGHLVIDVQAELIAEFDTRVVAPLVPRQRMPEPLAVLHPVFDIDDEPHVMVTQQLAAVPRSQLGRPIGSMADQYDPIVRALDMLFTGF